MIHNSYPLVEKTQLAKHEAVLWLEAPALTAEALPGQFVMVSTLNGDSFLKKAISIHAVEGDRLGLAILGVGAGTEALLRLPVAEKVDVIGPLGHGFKTDITGKKVVMVGGGIGKAPFRYLAEVLLKAGNDIHLVVGGRDASALGGLEWAMDLDLPLYVASEDGSLGLQGYVTAWEEIMLSADLLVACGPTPMLKSVQALALAHQIPCQISLEGKMACGMGVCLGCTCKKPDAEAFYHKVCMDGPVFWAEEVDLND